MSIKYSKLLLLQWLCLVATVVSAQSITNGFALPESIVSDGKRFFVSNIGHTADVLAKDGDGFISEIDAQGKLISAQFQKGTLHAPKGLAIANEVIYVADVDRVVGFNLRTGAQIFELHIPNAGLLNDLCRLDKNTLLVSDSFKDKVYTIDVIQKKYQVLGEVPGPNGILYQAATKKVYVCTAGEKLNGKGTIYEKDLANAASGFRILPNAPVGFFDGIAGVDETHLLLSDWVAFPSPGFGKLWMYDLVKHTAELILWEESPADFFYDQNSRNIYIPQSLKNRIVITDLTQLKDKSSKTSSTPVYNLFYQFGIASAFIGGLYQGLLPISKLIQHGDFGLGAPDHLDGELVMNQGRVYQTKASGQTIEVADSSTISTAFTCFFQTDTSYTSDKLLTKAQAFQWLDGLLTNPNGIYAIRISGTFENLKTRAFPPVRQEPFPALTSLMDQQQFFELRKTKGTLIGFKLPSYLDGISIAGYHFHFLSENKDAGGHIIDFTWQNVSIEVDELRDFTIELPQSEAFKQFDFKRTQASDLKQVESGVR